MVDEKLLLSARVKALRTQRGWSIAETARRADVSVSMLWKVENAQTTLTYGKLAKLAAGLGVPVGELFATSEPAVPKGGRRVVERRGEGPVVDVKSNLHRFLATEIVHKHYSPCIVDVQAAADNGEGAEAHGGEEFTFVIEGRVRFLCEGYAPVVLETGDSVYFDASMPHRYLRADDGPARILCIYSHPENARGDEAGDIEPHSSALRALADLTASNESHKPPRVRRGR